MLLFRQRITTTSEGPMGRHHESNSLLHALAGLTLVVAAVGATGCQSSINGQTLPSPHYLHDDVQYFPAGPEFKLSREAAALRAAEAEAKLEAR